MMPRFVGVMLALTLTAAACATDDPTGADATPAPGIEPTLLSVSDFDDDSGLTGIAAELALIREAHDYRLPLDAALDLFASTFGAIPGGDVDRFEVRPDDGTLATMALLAHWDSLSEEQRQAALALLGYSDVQSLRPGISASLRPGISAGSATAALQARVSAARAAIAAAIGEDIPFPIVVEAVPGLLGSKGQPVYGNAMPERDGKPAVSGAPDRCRIRLNADSGLDDHTIAHEVFHCFQYHLAGDVARVHRAQKWIIEGGAVWAASRVAGVNAPVEARFRQWLVHLGSLFALDYPAVGFFWVIESMGVDPWAVMRPMILAGGGEDAVAATGLDPGQALLRMATSPARRSLAPTLDVSEQWDFSASGVPNLGRRVTRTVTPETPLQFDSPKPVFSRLNAGVATLEGGTIVEIKATSGVGMIEFFDSTRRVWEGDFHERFCLEDEEECSCGTQGDEALEVVDRELAVAVAERHGGDVSLTIVLEECWSVTIVSETTRDYLNPEYNEPDKFQIAPGACSDTWVTEFTFTVGPDGAFTTDGTARVTAGAQCSFPTTAPPLTAWTLMISGTATEDAFEFQIILVASPAGEGDYSAYGSLVFEDGFSVRTIAVPRTGEEPFRVEHTYTNHDLTPPDLYTSLNVIEVRRAADR